MKHTNKTLKRIIVKVGTSSLVSENGSLDRDKMICLIDQLAQLMKEGKEVVLVSSGAIRAGMEKLGFTERPSTIPDQQASAAVGQSALMQLYTEILANYNIIPGQVLLTRDDFRNRERYLNARNTLYTLLRFGCLPIVNENDTVATDEIKFGENDALAALVGACLDADLVLNLSDVDGLYDQDPRSSDTCKLIEEIAEITPEIEALAGGANGVCGSGGMKSKIEAAKIAVNSGARMVIARAGQPNVIIDAAHGKNVGTRFLSNAKGLNHRKRWIAFASRVKGSIIVNDGAKSAIMDKGKSLLSAGIVNCEGSFLVGDLVSVLDEYGNKVARGLANYSSDEIMSIRGLKSSDIEKTLGYKGFDEVIHRDNMVIGV
ncbi:MAG: glutamate 5-kinase [Armatimonadota bacterium]